MKSKTSKLEWLTRAYLKHYFPEDEPFYNYRPDFLKTPATGKNLEIDIFYPFLRFGVEVNSIFHNTKRGKERDRFKLEKCRENGIVLFQVWRPDHVINLRHKLRQNFPSEASLRVPLPQNEYLAIAGYTPTQTKAGRAVQFQIAYEKAADMQAQEVANIVARRDAKSRSA